MSIDFRCELCGAKPGKPCRNTLQRRNAPQSDRAIPGGRVEHYARALPPDDTARRRKAKA